MPSKKPNKAAKRPGKATPKKATPKVAAPKKKVVKPPAKPMPLATTKVPVKSTKPIPKVAAAVKPAAAKPPRAKAAPEAAAARVAAEPVAPIKFDPRPLVMPRAAQNDEDADGES